MYSDSDFRHFVDVYLLTSSNSSSTFWPFLRVSIHHFAISKYSISRPFRFAIHFSATICSCCVPVWFLCGCIISCRHWSGVIIFAASCISVSDVISGSGLILWVGKVVAERRCWSALRFWEGEREVGRIDMWSWEYLRDVRVNEILSKPPKFRGERKWNGREKWETGRDRKVEMGTGKHGKVDVDKVEV